MQTSGDQRREKAKLYPHCENRSEANQCYVVRTMDCRCAQNGGRAGRREPRGLALAT